MISFLNVLFPPFLLAVVYVQLFERDPSRRLGIVGNVRTQSFFKSVNWSALERREVDPPFKPKVVCSLISFRLVLLEAFVFFSVR